MPGERNTRIALLDFDSHKGEVSWTQMVFEAERVAKTLTHNGYEPVAFRSSGGQGIHLMMLWDEAQDAYSVRMTLAAALAVHSLTDGVKGVKHNEVEIFPKQDEVAIDEFGSMFILPFAGKSEHLW